jgi:hypothetical protein
MLKSIQQRDLDRNRWIKITMTVILVIICFRWSAESGHARPEHPSHAQGHVHEQVLDQVVQQNVQCDLRPCASRSTKPEYMGAEAPKMAFIARIGRVRISAKAVC